MDDISGKKYIDYYLIVPYHKRLVGFLYGSYGLNSLGIIGQKEAFSVMLYKLVAYLDQYQQGYFKIININLIWFAESHPLLMLLVLSPVPYLGLNDVLGPQTGPYLGLNDLLGHLFKLVPTWVWMTKWSFIRYQLNWTSLNSLLNLNHVLRFLILVLFSIKSMIELCFWFLLKINSVSFFICCI